MSRPNIVLIHCHDLGTLLHCYGEESVVSPNLDGLARQGVRFDNYFCTAPQCSPSRSSIATGRYPHANGMMGLAHKPFGWRLHPDERTMAQLLRDGGYRTVLTGFQHLADNAEALGYDTWHRAQFCAEVSTAAREALAVLRRDEQPFLLEIGLIEPHRPFDMGGAAPDRERGVNVPPWLPDNEPTRTELAEIQGAVRHVDASIGRVLEAVDAGDASDTLVIFTTDHGIAFPWAKGTLYDPGLRTALLMRGPGLTPGSSVDTLLSNVDLLPTVLQACGLPVPNNVHGASMWGLLHGEDDATREAIFAEKSFHNMYDPMRCIRTRRHKLIRNFECNNVIEVPSDTMRGGCYISLINQCTADKHAPLELYDLEADPWERHNLAGQPEHAKTQADLERRLARWMRETGDPLLEGPIRSPYYRESVEALQRAEAGGV